MHLKSIFALLIVLFSTLVKAEQLLLNSTSLELSINSSSLGKFKHTMETLDGKPGVLTISEADGTPISRLKIHTSKVYQQGNDEALVRTEVQFSEFKNGEWLSVNNSSIVNHQNKEGSILISGADKELSIDVLAKGTKTPLSKAQALSTNECESSQLSNFGDHKSSVKSSHEGCCSVQLPGGETLSCCGAISCCANSVCCSPNT